jgi:hypothetical protein
VIKALSRHFDPWSLLVIALTLALFLFALFVKGLTHELLLETGVFLVSAKLILMAHKNSVTAEQTDERLRNIQSSLRAMAERSEGPGTMRDAS